MTDHATGAQAATDCPEIEIGANGQSSNPRYVPLPDGSLFDIAEYHGLTPGERPRCDGWTADRQRHPVPPEQAHWTNFRLTFRARRDGAEVNSAPSVGAFPPRWPSEPAPSRGLAISGFAATRLGAFG